jgi:hypothetical protein
MYWFFSIGDFYPANSVEPKVRSTPENRDFCIIDGAKINKRGRLLEVRNQDMGASGYSGLRAAAFRSGTKDSRLRLAPAAALLLAPVFWYCCSHKGGGGHNVSAIHTETTLKNAVDEAIVSAGIVKDHEVRQTTVQALIDTAHRHR